MLAPIKWSTSCYSSGSPFDQYAIGYILIGMKLCSIMGGACVCVCKELEFWEGVPPNRSMEIRHVCAFLGCLYRKKKMNPWLG